MEHLQAQAPGAGAPDLDGDADLLPRWRSRLRPSFQAAEEELVDSTWSSSGSRSGATIARRSLGKISHAVS